MRLLIDTHLLLWSLGAPERLPKDARALMENDEHERCFSVVVIWEIAIKRALDKPGFRTDPSLVRRALTDAGYTEIPVTSDHAIALLALPPLHRDPFDRILVAQAHVEGAILLTSDRAVAQYPGGIRLV